MGIGRLFSIGSIAATSLFIVGCSGEPSESDIAQAVERSFESANQQVRQFGNHPNLRSQVHSVKKLGCEATAQGNAFLCDVETDVTVPLLGRTKNTGRVRMVKGSDGWVMMK